MKKLPLLILGGAALLFASCCGGRYSNVAANLYVVDDAGRPLEGVILEPTQLTFGCECYDLTDGCGRASVGENGYVNLRRGGFNSVLSVPVNASGTTYVQMHAQGFGSKDSPVYYSGGGVHK